MSKPEPTKCAAPNCEKPIARKVPSRRGREQSYCGRRCRQRAYRARGGVTNCRDDRAAIISASPTRGSGGVTNEEKKINIVSGLQTPKTRPSLCNRAPSVTLVGSGQRTPWTGYALDRATREAILYAEVGALTVTKE